MAYWCGIDLHSNNSVVAVIDEADHRRLSKRLPNHLGGILNELEPFRKELLGIVVESTYNWYWLVDGLMDAGYRVHLANPAAIKQYSGLKHSDDFSDAHWLGHLLRIGVLREGYIYPKEDRALRDLMRKRMQLVQQRTTNLLSIQSQIQRTRGIRLSGEQIKKLDAERLGELAVVPEVMMAIVSNLEVLRCLNAQVELLEKTVRNRCRVRERFQQLSTICGVGDILAMTIMLEVGDIERFATVGDFASYCRCVSSERSSNGKKKGVGNVKNGNPYLSWAWVEAANFAVRFYEPVRRFYNRKVARTNSIVGRKAVAHKLARAGYHVMIEQKPFELERAFS
jgi:transposase